LDHFLLDLLDILALAYRLDAPFEHLPGIPVYNDDRKICFSANYHCFLSNLP